MSESTHWPDHYGPDEPAATAREYEALREGVALLGLGDHALVEATGPQRAKFLQGMVTNDVVGLEQDGVCRAALLDAHGGVLALLRVVVAGPTLLLETDGSRAPRVAQILERYRVAAPVRFRTLPTALVGLAGPGVRGLAARLTGVAEDRLGERASAASLDGVDLRLVPAPDLGAGAIVIHTAPESAAAVSQALRGAGAVPAGRLAFDTYRIEQGLPWWGAEVTEGTLLHETGLVRALCSFTKGCYVGQEIVARLEARGANVNRALRSLRSAAVLQIGAELRVGSDVVGHVTTAGHSPRRGPVAMAYVHRKHFTPGTVVTVDGQEATVGPLPMPD